MAALRWAGLILGRKWPWGGRMAPPREVLFSALLVFLHLPNSWRSLQPFWSVFTSEWVPWLWHVFRMLKNVDVLCVTYRFPPSSISKRERGKKAASKAASKRRCVPLDECCFAILCNWCTSVILQYLQSKPEVLGQGSNSSTTLEVLCSSLVSNCINFWPSSADSWSYHLGRHLDVALSLQPESWV